MSDVTINEGLGRSRFGACVVHSDDAMASVLERVLRFQGIRAMHHAIDLHDLYRHRRMLEKLQLIVLDLSYPDGHASDALETLGQVGFTGDVVILGGTDSEMNEALSDLAALRGMRVEACLTPPFPMRAILEAISTWHRRVAARTLHVGDPSLQPNNDERAEIVAHYAPIIRLPNQRISGFEVVPMLRRSGIGVASTWTPVGSDNRYEAGKLARAGLDAGLEMRRHVDDAEHGLEVHVNLPAAFVCDPLAAAIVSDRVESAGVPRSEVSLEVCERDVRNESPAFDLGLQRLADEGFSIMVDSVGANAISLARLQALPLRGVKLNQQALAGAARSQVLSHMLDVVGAIASENQIEIAAEGVQNGLDLSIAMLFGATSAQGAGVGLPTPGPCFRHRFGHEARFPFIALGEHGPTHDRHDLAG